MGFDPPLLPQPVTTNNNNNPAAGVNYPNPITDDPSKKIRKPYTITKSRQNWTDVEHDKFLEALHLFDRDWKKIEAFVGSKTAIQIRSHAQKYFLKVQKSGTNEHVPPPRPKRKASHPYPHKAPKNDAPIILGAQQSATGVIKHEDIIMNNPYQWATNPWMYSNTITAPDEPTQEDVRSHNCCSSSSEGDPGKWSAGETTSLHDVRQRKIARVMPDFPKVYRFIGGIFDPNESNHLQKLKMMDPVDVETVVLLMKNLCANLKSPQFEDYKKLFSSYDVDTGKVTSSGSLSGLQALPGKAIPS
ncbi:protein REVEILLE 3-like [Bidens hawaiensis]|uniref:protein REVEILLE 3-like n=1 Tax=Bidens hawaiensis TaxID=980011 RepID=UPI00404A1816